MSWRAGHDAVPLVQELFTTPTMGASLLASIMAVKTAFDTCDADGSGAIDTQELVQVCVVV